jgi:hypothetical protein
VTHRYFGWLFGLEGDPGIVLRAPGLVVRAATPMEQERIVRCSTDFFAHDLRTWAHAVDRFPFVYEKEWPDNSLQLGGEDGVGLMFALLSRGEVRTPVQWSADERGGESQASSSTVVVHFFRLMNGEFGTLDVEEIASVFGLAAERLRRLIFGSPSDVLGTVLLDRFMATKAHPIVSDMLLAETHLVARAADVAMLLEHLFYEGNKPEVVFRLGMSVAWVLGEDADERQAILKAVKSAYDLRSKRVHGARLGKKDVRSAHFESVGLADRLLRRAIVARLLSTGDDGAWVRVFTAARVGALPNGFDQADWVP